MHGSLYDPCLIFDTNNTIDQSHYFIRISNCTPPFVGLFGSCLIFFAHSLHWTLKLIKLKSYFCIFPPPNQNPWHQASELEPDHGGEIVLLVPVRVVISCTHQVEIKDSEECIFKSYLEIHVTYRP